MNSRRLRNAEIFKDTEYQYKTNELLRKAVEKSKAGQYFLSEDDELDISGVTPEREGKVVVSGKRTLEASEEYVKAGKKVCVLNFASATNPGGGVVHGASAQEEAICRCSTLYPCLNESSMWADFYLPHRAADNPLYNADCIFTPGVKVFKSDTNYPESLKESDCWEVDVITCAAPNLRNMPSNRMNPNAGSKKAEIGYEDLRKLLTKRIRRIFELAVTEGAEVLILGAFGCGAFKNPPELVAKVFRKVMEEYRKCFETVEYAVYCAGDERKNYEAFEREMGDL